MTNNNDTREAAVSVLRPIPTATAVYYSPLDDETRADATACRRVLRGSTTVEEAAARLSTSEKIVVALAFGRADLLPRPYDDYRTAWRRLDSRQRQLVDVAARAYWEGQDEGSPC